MPKLVTLDDAATLYERSNESMKQVFRDLKKPYKQKPFFEFCDNLKKWGWVITEPEDYIIRHCGGRI